jgi:hypothetical protein
MTPRFPSLLIFTASLLAGCGGSSCDLCGGPPPPLKSPIAAQPASVTFPNRQSAQTVTVTLNGGVAPYKAVAMDARYVDVSTPSTVSGVTTFTVSPVAGGTTSIAVSDSAGDVALDVPVTIQTCEPPFPALFMVYPSNSATAVSPGIANLWAALLTTDPFVSGISAFQTRLVGSDYSVIKGGNFALTTATPPPGSTIPPSSGGGYTYTYDYLTSSVSGLKAGVTYQIQVTLATYTCVPPLMLGTFST